MKPPIGLSLVILLILAAAGCTKEIFQLPFDPVLLSGTWYGTSTIKKKGLCTSADSIATVEQSWQVTSSGSITIVELGSMEWTGSVDKDRNFTITQTQEVNCFGTLSTKSFTLTGKIFQSGTSFSIHETMDFSLCPPDCLFNKEYVLSK